MGRHEEWQTATARIRDVQVLLTADQGLRFQQNVAQFRTTLPDLQRMLPDIRSVVARVAPGEIIVVTPR